MFQYTEKQKNLFDILKNDDKRFYLIDGGSRSGKTVALCKWFILRCLKYPNSRRLLARKSKLSCKNSVWSQTLLLMLVKDYKGAYDENKTDRIIRFKNGSEIWMGGFDNPLHEDDVLGQEWFDIWINESTDTTFSIFGKLKTRLNCSPEYKKNNNFSGKFLLDCNPKGSGHWLNKYFIKHLNVETGAVLRAEELFNIDRISFHPLDNKVNLDPEYIKDLERQVGLNKKRFWEGIWADLVDNAVYNFDRKVSVLNSDVSYSPHYETWCSMDFGVSDPTSIIWYQILPVPKTVDNPKGIIINIIDEYETNNQPVSHYVDVIRRKQYDNVSYCGDPSGNNRNESLESWISKFQQSGIYVRSKSYKNRLELIDNSNEYMNYIRVNENKCPKTVEMFENWELELDKNGVAREGIPAHSEYSHLGTSFYFFMLNRFPLKPDAKIYI